MDNLLTDRNYNLDLIKIVACMAVVGLHTLQKDLSIINSSLYYLCGFAVPAFFMSNGYITLNRTDIDAGYSVKKVINILRVALCWSGIVFVGQVIYEITHGYATVELLIQLPLTFIKGFVQKGYLWHFWFLGALIIVYFMLPLLVKHRGKLCHIWFTLICIGLVFQVISYCLGMPIQRYCIQTFRVWTWLQYFILGGLIGEKNRDKILGLDIKKSRIFLIFATVWIVVFQNIASHFWIHDLHAEYFYDSIFTVIWLILIFTFGGNINLTTGQTAVIKKITPLTMGIYIVHPIVLKLVGFFIEADTIMKSILFFAIVLATSTLIVYVIIKISVVNKLVKL